LCSNYLIVRIIMFISMSLAVAACSGGPTEIEESEWVEELEAGLDAEGESAASLSSPLIRPPPPCPPGSACDVEPLDPCAFVFCAFEKVCVVRDGIPKCE
jgi:hypothetical protein